MWYCNFIFFPKLHVVITLSKDLWPSNNMVHQLRLLNLSLEIQRIDLGWAVFLVLRIKVYENWISYSYTQHIWSGLPGFMQVWRSSCVTELNWEGSLFVLKWLDPWSNIPTTTTISPLNSPNSLKTFMLPLYLHNAQISNVNTPQ